MSKKLEKAKSRNLGQLLLRAARLYNEKSVARFQETEPRFTLAHTKLMPHIDLGGTRPSEIAKRACITKQAVGQLISELEELEVVERRPDPADGRAKLVFFSETGLELLVVGLGVLKSTEEDAAQDLGEKRIEQLKDILTLLVEHLE